MSSDPYWYLYKFIVIGTTGVGKSSILSRFLRNKFDSMFAHTVGVELESRMVDMGAGKMVKLQIWDTAGQERFKSVTKSYYRGAAGVVIVFDVTNRETYNAVAGWLKDARKTVAPDAVIILVGNKTDIEDQREVPVLEASAFAQVNGMFFDETSAANGSGVEDVFMRLARTITDRIESGEIDPSGHASGIQVGQLALQQGRGRQPAGLAQGHDGSARSGGCCQ